MSDEPEDLPVGGYVPGKYWDRCLSCGGTFTGDKRCLTCRGCALGRAAADGARRDGRNYGINEAVSRLALWERSAVGEEITFAEHAIKIVAALLPTPPQPDPVAVAREAVVSTAMANWRGLKTKVMAENIADARAEHEACAALAALEKGEG